LTTCACNEEPRETEALRAILAHERQGDTQDRLESLHVFDPSDFSHGRQWLQRNAVSLEITFRTSLARNKCPVNRDKSAAIPSTAPHCQFFLASKVTVIKVVNACTSVEAA
jgi:hypothetical protein